MIVMDKLLTLSEVADILRVNEDTVRRLIARKEFKAVRVGGRLRVKESILNEYINREDKK